MTTKGLQKDDRQIQYGQTTGRLAKDYRKTTERLMKDHRLMQYRKTTQRL